VVFRRIVNASPLIFLVKIGLVEVLREGAWTVLVPDAVVDEIARYGSQDQALQTIHSTPWLQVVATPSIPSPIAARRLGAGESAVLAVALEAGGAEVVLDDRAARRCALDLGLPVQGTLSLVVQAKHAGMINEVQPVLEQLRALGFFLSDQLVQLVLKAAGEDAPR
jgi:predicted nucleic acid-binding protein